MLRSSLLTTEETTSFLVSCLAATLALVVVLATLGAVVVWPPPSQLPWVLGSEEWDAALASGLPLLRSDL